MEEVVQLLGFVWEEVSCARHSLYTPEATEGCDTRGIGITSLAEVGGGRSVGEASPLLGQVCVSTDGPITMRRAGGPGTRRIFDRTDANGCSTSICVVPLEMR
jgi:hypothetical protein